MDPKRSKFIGSLLGAAIGDSLGARREGATDFIDITEISPRYTDDTALMIGVAESLVEKGDFDYQHMAEQLIQNYEREPWRRYDAATPRIFRMMRNGRLWEGMLDREIYPQGSPGNGAATRVAPIGLRYHADPKSLRDIAYNAAGITHSHPLALEGAAVQACAVALAVLVEKPLEIRKKEFLGALRMFTQPGPYQEKLKAIIRLLDADTGKKEVVKILGNSSEALNSVPIALYCFLANPDFESAVIYAASLGGDADAIGAMTGAIAGACFGVEGIPSQWREKVEQHAAIESLAIKLWGKTAAETV
jgi:poly(ADP-ribose) glycohydrolase ARH3